MDTIPLYKAIREMREISKDNGMFTIQFMSCNLTAGKSDGPVFIKNARLRSGDTKEHNKNHEFMINLHDVDNNRDLRCYQPTIMYFNHQQVVLE